MEEVSVDFVQTETLNILEETDPWEDGSRKFITPFSNISYLKNNTFTEDYIDIPKIVVTSSEDNLKLVDVDFQKDALDWIEYKEQYPVTTIERVTEPTIPNTYEPYFTFKKVEIPKEDESSDPIVVGEDDDPFGDSLDDGGKQDQQDQQDQQQQQEEDPLVQKKLKHYPKPLQYTIGFLSSIEGSHENTINLYILGERVHKTPQPEETPINTLRQNYQYVKIGEIRVHNDVIGFDDRHRTFFDNFGVPDPKTYDTLFADVNPYEEGTNAIHTNEKSKELFLEYDKIFPYRGTYKALINAVRYLGYDDLFFREWYKVVEPKSSAVNKYVNYISLDMSNEDGDILNVKDKLHNANIDFETYLSMKKLNRLSMMYRLNKETDETDIMDVPIIRNIYLHSNEELLVKLFRLREWLEEHIIGVNCRITDVTGEGIYFQWFKNPIYHTDTYIHGFDKSVNLSPVPASNVSSYKIDDRTITADVKLSLREIDKYPNELDKATGLTIGELDNFRIRDFVKHFTRFNITAGENNKSVSDITNKDALGFYDTFYKQNIVENKLLAQDTNDAYITSEEIYDLDEWDENSLFDVPYSAPFNAPVLL